MTIKTKNAITDVEESFRKKESNAFYKCYEETYCWKQLRDFYYETFPEQEASAWLFRGDVFVYEKDSDHLMRNAFKTSLDKAFEEFETELQRRSKIEKAIIRAFRRRAPLFTDDKYVAQNQLEALALMRHHGAPARILDWMYSFFPAVYLAMNREYNKKAEYTTYTIWALNRKWLHFENVLFENRIFLRDTGYFREHFLTLKDSKYYQEYDNSLFQKFVVTYMINKNPASLIYAATPYRFNERLAAQRGTLLFSSKVDRNWGENLQDMIRNSVKRWPPKDKNGRVMKGVKPILCEITFTLSKKERGEFLRGLDEMNVNQVTLFPDLDGFAESLRTRIAHPESLGIYDD